MARHLGRAYLRYSFTQGTAQEVAFLVDALALRPGARVLDVGCGPGRHAHALAEAGYRVVGVDISEEFIELAREGAPPSATFVRADARDLAYDAEFDAVLSLCQGGFGLLQGSDDAVLAGMRRAARPGGRIALTAISAYFAIRFLEQGEEFDAASGVLHERTGLRNEEGETAEFDLWTTCFTPRELRLMAARVGLEVEDIWSVGPGDYARRAPDLDHPELLLIGRV